MVRRVALVALAVLIVGGLVWAAEKEVTGTVKSITGGTFVVTDSAGKDWTFAVDSKETLVVAKGGHHKLDALKAGADMIHVPVFLGLSERPVALGSNGHRIIQQGGQCWTVPEVAQGSVALQVRVAV